MRVRNLTVQITTLSSEINTLDAVIKLLQYNVLNGKEENSSLTSAFHYIGVPLQF